MHHELRSLVCTTPVSVPRQRTGKSIKHRKSPQNPDSVSAKWLNQNPAPKRLNILTVPIQVQNRRNNCLPRKKWKTISCSRQCHFKSSHVTEPQSTEQCLLQHAQIIVPQYLIPISLACEYDTAVQAQHMLCVFDLWAKVHSRSQEGTQVTAYLWGNAELAKTKRLLACSGESLHLPVEPQS